MESSSRRVHEVAWPPPPLGPPANTKIVPAGFVGEVIKLLKLDGCCFNAGNIAA